MNMDRPTQGLQRVSSPWRTFGLSALLLGVTAGALCWLGAALAPVLPVPVLALLGALLAAGLAVPVLRSGAARQGGEALAPEGPRAERIVNLAAEAILTVNPRGQLLSLNAAAEQLFGYRGTEVLNEPITKLLTEPPPPQSSSLFHDTLPVGSILGLAAGAREMIGRRKSGETFPLELAISSMTVDDAPFTVAFARDVSKRKQAQRNLTAHYAATCILAEARSLAEALPRILQSICEALHWEVGAFWRFDPGAGAFCGVEAYQASFAALPKGPDVRSVTVQAEQGLLGRVLATGKPTWVEDLLGTEGPLHTALAAPLQLHGAFAFPILLGEEVCAAMTFFSSRKRKREAQLLDIVAGLGKQLGQFIARKRDEERLQRSEERFRQLAENIHEVFWMADARDDRVLYLSPSGEEVWGRPCRDLQEQPRPFLDFVHPEDRDRVLAAAQRQRRGEDTSEEYRIVRPDGAVRWVWDRAFPIRDDTGQAYRIAGLTADITDRRRTEAVLRETTQTLQALVRAAPVAINIIDLEGKVRLWNPAAERILGWAEGEVLGQPLPSLHEDGNGDPSGSPAAVLQGQTYHELQTRCRKKDGTVIDVRLSAAPLRNTEGKIFGAMAVLVDLTEQKQLEDWVRQAQKMEAVGQLAGGVAHDFNNLLTVIAGYSELLLAAPGPAGPAREALEQIHSAAERAAALTCQLLAFGRKQAFQGQDLDLNGVVQDMGKMLSRLIGEDVEMVIRQGPLLGLVHTDLVQVEQILLNLAANARDAMPAGGTLTITTANVELGKASSSLPPDVAPGPYVMLAVGDTGCGMDAATQARIFEPFFTTKEVGRGTGLGLATVYGIVKQSRGHIEVESAVGRGSTFRIYLPRLRPAGSTACEADDASDSPRGKETVLLVEDEDEVRKFVNHALRLSGYTVLEASSGREALKLCEEHKGEIALLMTDVIMPHMNGRQLAEQATSQQEDLKVLYISGYTDRVLDDQGILAPGIELLQKPITPGALARKVREVLDAPRSKRKMAGVTGP
jgi:PAS domain S-box-containing protein